MDGKNMEVGDIVRFKATQVVGMIILPTLPKVNDEGWVSVMCSKAGGKKGFRIIITDFLLEYLEECAEVINGSR
jgi:hypothetical protein